MTLIDPKEWRPLGIDDLEAAAWTALRAGGNTSVIAGPGAGKTEFLAQRAGYLLQTGLCPYPQRILAISFKRDARRNLAERVAERCAPNLACRLDSQTYDGFAKSLVDRFLPAIPSFWRPDRDYRLAPARVQDYREFINGIDDSSIPSDWSSEIRAIQPKDFEKKYLAMMTLPLGPPKPGSGRAWAVCEWWSRSLRKGKHSTLNFIMILRLAELLLRANEKILEALRLTYPYIMLDEFQDTTHPQYALVRTAFMNSGSVLTAVGDDKQRIMLWAGARSDAFKKFEEEFQAKPVPFRANYRSTKELVRIQHVVARAIEPSVVEPESLAKTEVTGDVAEIWQFPSQQAEAKGIGSRIAADIQAVGLKPRDFALLVRQKADDYEDDLTQAFANCGLRIRNENRSIGKVTIQDLLAEELTGLVLPFLRLGARDRARTAWNDCIDNLIWLRGIDPEDEIENRRLTGALEKCTQTLRQKMRAESPCKNGTTEILGLVLDFLDRELIRQAVREYAQDEERFSEVLESLELFLQECAENEEAWDAVLDMFEGADQVPLMTVHKSKGLEFHTMIFVGLDDHAWWSFASSDMEGLSTFFVALSRARQRAFFSYCPHRGGRQKIAKLYALLQEAEVPEVQFNE